MSGILGSSSSHFVGRFATYGQKSGSSQQNKGIQRCQKCLQFGHFTFECKNEAAYTARPSRTQQLKNPKLRQGFLSAEDLPPELNPDLKKAAKEKKQKKRGRSPSPSSSSSSDSDSDSDSGTTSTDGSSSSSESGSSSSSSGSSSSDGSTSSDSSSDSGSESSDDSDSDSGDVKHKRGGRQVGKEPMEKRKKGN
ncbi:hypothetical protein CEUSTIGMA_g2238.t1 [Chlamydomonas eustigma]|uniref:Uncharacterized protein n=1 Tax=Chlamydomonas eustigma TaxID=1157962 RepID=A0A250WVE5_9CHLO|nr:hypothetical protein CEUSTIGMA_g2238.t1 [Chlamydomonas eustigma]|eukprot:GAX74791.1 hypothetical protein CEUSTIGMA_g2238.t1 [Chlamydomonas eustigma]